MKERPDRSTMAGLFRSAGIDLTSPQEELFWRFYTLIASHNRELDLSRLTRFDDIIIKHFIDSIYILKFFSMPASLLDIGTGAGFPGIPLKIMEPRLELVLAEPRHKRVSFLEMAVAELGLEKVSIYPHLVGEHSFFDTSGVITRALETVDDTLSRVIHFLPPGGMVIFMKGPAAAKDLETLSRKNRDGFSLIQDREYVLPGTGHRRRLLILEKRSDRRRKTYRILTRAGETMGKEITSTENKTYREFKRLSSVEGIKKSGRLLAAGKKEVLDLLRSHPGNARALIIYDGYAEDDPALMAAIAEFDESSRLYILKKGLYNELDQFTTGSPLLVMEHPPLEPWIPQANEGCTLLVPFQDPSNVGAVIRTAAAFEVPRIVALREAAFPFHPRAVRASGGAVFSVNVTRGPSIDEVASIADTHRLPLVTLDAAGVPLREFTFPARFLLLPGVEGPGLPPALKKHSVSIPIGPGVESLNAATATAIALYEWRGGGKIG